MGSFDQEAWEELVFIKKEGSDIGNCPQTKGEGGDRSGKIRNCERTGKREDG